MISLRTTPRFPWRVFAARARADRSRAVLRVPNSLRSPFRRWAEAAGIAKTISPHVFRRTQVDLLRLAEVDAVVARSLVGHATEEMTQHYSHVAAEERRRAAGRVLALIEGGGGT